MATWKTHISITEGKRWITIECVDRLKGVKSLGEGRVDTIYLDPPFFSQKVRSSRGKEGCEHSFSDRWNSFEESLHFLKPRLEECQRVFHWDGSLFLRCDQKELARLRILLDEIFGSSNSPREIVWSHERWTNARKGLIPNRGVILVYSESKDF